ncbi:MAG TPA: hypothetical protein VFZ08_05600 [Terriglobia bacterium]|nr:hypothetical protein [Terriglobia bacterium]
MTEFQNALEAKNFFITKISEEAVREGHALSDLELKMLWFTETGSDSRPESLDTAAEFSEKYDDDEYEKKVSHLLRKAYRRDLELAGDTNVREIKKTYQAARNALAKEDHYVMIMSDCIRKWFRGLAGAVSHRANWPQTLTEHRIVPPLL